MTVNTKKVARREVRYASFEEVLADAQKLTSGNAQTVGNWSLGQILQHLAKTMDASIDGTEMKVPWIMRTFFKMILNKDKMMREPLKPGFKIPKGGLAQFSPDANVTAEEGLAQLNSAVERFIQDSKRSEHPAFGHLTREEWDLLNLRHAEMHLSFAKLS